MKMPNMVLLGLYVAAVAVIGFDWVSDQSFAVGPMDVVSSLYLLVGVSWLATACVFTGWTSKSGNVPRVRVGHWVFWAAWPFFALGVVSFGILFG